MQSNLFEVFSKLIAECEFLNEIHKLRPIILVYYQERNDRAAELLLEYLQKEDELKIKNKIAQA